jgi:hypothetical protein
VPPFYNLYLNATRGGIKSIPDVAFQRAEARRHVQLSLAPKGGTDLISDSMIPSFLVTEAMIDRFLAIDPPVFRIIVPEYESVINEIEDGYVRGAFFAALAAAVVTIERTLNVVRIELHNAMKHKIKALWGKGPLNEWEGNIGALQQWGYLSETLAAEMRELYSVRCRYLHSGETSTLEADSLRAVHGAYALLKELIGFPPNLFALENGGIKCLKPQDPLVQLFYTPNIHFKDDPVA